ncbi:PxKF domain-containing protein [Cellulomonas marina]|uniref:Glycosyl hydrolases family 43 n=1 Tax=Cellulomonas marina TaxID=988821 RepID=A0A1I0WRC8_9CELL|nr:PxKF domain-containing protein [Cellulomonas marina]GIG27833.1 hypothetical protein Cma02nite_04330 [Cellulomonas marina]SFA91305.1 Glycosyl hydrolases family 43 [Cellulomonas marina]
MHVLPPHAAPAGAQPGRRGRGRAGLVAAGLGAALALTTAAAPPAVAASTFPALTPEALVAADFTLYFANAGATDTGGVAAGDHLGLYQSRTDQRLGEDPGTRTRWGYVVDATSNPVPRTAAGLEKTATLLYDDEPAGSSLPSRRVAYAFDVPAGSYDVTFGFAVPSAWGSRTVTAVTEGAVREQFATGTTPLAKTYAVDVSDGTLDVAVGSPANRTGRDADPLVSWVVVKAKPTWTPELLAARIADATLTATERAGYADDSVADLDAALAAAQRLLDAGSTDAVALAAASDAVVRATAALRPVVTYDSFRPGQPWLDDQGRVINAHGGQVVPATDAAGERIWYWYGEDRSKGYYDSPGVHVYSSRDLYNWTDEGLALRAMSSQDQFASDPYFSALYGGYTDAQREVVWRDLSTNRVRTDGWAAPAILERPKVIYNEVTEKWVMWVHSDGPATKDQTSTYARAEAGVAVADSPTGPFRWIDSYRLNRVPSGSVPWCGTGSAFDPAGGMARDMNLFVDTDGTGYIIYSSEENRTMYISKLNSDYTYLSATPETAVQGVDFVRTLPCAQREAPAMMKQDGTYYLVTSGATGWDPNPARYATATSILGTWTDRGNPITGAGAENTFRSQSTSIIPIDPARGKFVYMGDRWTPDDLSNAPYVWLPVTLSGEAGDLSLTNPAEWDLGDLPTYEPWDVAVTMPDHVTLGDTAGLPAQVQVTSGGTTTTQAVRWDAASIGAPGVRTARATLPDGRTFSRSVLVVPAGLRYAVNAGGTATADWTALVGVAQADRPLLNSAPEQPLGTDPVTGARWGFTGASGTEGTALGTIDTTLRWARDKQPLVYTFTGLDAGTYTVRAGWYDPWPQANRAARVSINGKVVDEQQLFTATPVADAYPGVVVGADGTITVTVAPTRSPDIQVSWLTVEQVPQAQTVSLEPLGDVLFGETASVEAVASSSSGLPVTLTAEGACTVEGTTVTPTRAGTCTVTATQAGDHGWLAAAPVSRSFEVRPWTIVGFAAPVDMGGVVNTARAGSTVPVRFEVLQGDLELVDPAVVASVTVARAAVPGGTPTDEVEAVGTGATGLRYDAAAGHFVHTWRTPSTPGTYRLTVTTQDGSTLGALFRLR